MVEEDLLIDHPIDCPICDKAGECYLQDYHFEHGQKQRRADIRPFTSRRRDMGEHRHAVRRSLRDVQPLRPLHPRDQRHRRTDGHQSRQPRRDRRLSRLSAGKQDVGQCRRSVPGRGAGRPGFSLQAARLVHEAARRAFAPAARPAARSWSKKTRTRFIGSSRARTRTSTSGGCATKGATAITTFTAPTGCSSCARREGSGHVNVEWAACPGRNRRPAASPRAAWRAVISPHLTVEEAYLLAKYVRRIDPQAVLALGPVPVVGEDETFPERLYDPRREVPQSPRRRGSRRPLHAAACHARRFAGRASTAGEIRGAWVSGGYQPPWIDDATAARFDPLGSPGRAGYVQLSAVGAGDVSIARRRLCRTRRLVRQPCRSPAIRPLGRFARRPACGSKAGVYWRLLKRAGPVQRPPRAGRGRRRDSAILPSPPMPVPPVGVDLKVNLLAAGDDLESVDLRAERTGFMSTLEP